MDAGLRERSLAIVDVETSGDDELRHELLEIGLLVVRQDDLSVFDEWNVKVKPHYIETAIPAALERNGYTADGWKDAIELSGAMRTFAEKTKGAIFTAYNVTFDWAFIRQAFRSSGIANGMDYHRFDILTFAWAKLGGRLDKLNLEYVAGLLGVTPEPKPHRAVHGAKTALEVLKKLREI